MGAPWETFAPWEDAATNYVNKVGGAARNLYNTAKTSAPWETAVGLGQTALEVGSGTLKALNTAANDLIPGDKKALQKQIDTDPVMNYHATSPTGKAATNLLGEVAAPVGGAAGWANNKIRAVAGEGAAATLADVLTLVTGRVAPESGAAKSEMTTYHGSRHKIAPTEKNPLGEFRLDKVDSGEGAQAYGHGIYVAENPDVARSYTLAGAEPVRIDPSAVTYKGKTVDAHYTEATKALDKLDRQKMPVDDPRYQKALARTTFWEYAATKHHPQGIINNVGASPDVAAYGKSLDMKKFEGLPEMSKGNFYHVEVPDEHVEKFLDWDKPLHEQTPEVQRALTAATGGEFIERNRSGMSNGPYLTRNGSPLNVKGIYDELTLTAENTRELYDTAAEDVHADVKKAIKDYTRDPDNKRARDQLNEFFHDYPYDKEQHGSAMDALESEHGISTGDLYKGLAQRLGGQQEASEYLKSQGIPGIKYFDAVSRRDNEGSRNLVLFDPSIATITKRE